MQSLSEAYANRPSGLAHCPGCGTTFIDDVPLYGVLFCPNGCTINSSPWVLIRDRIVRSRVLKSVNDPALEGRPIFDSTNALPK